MASLPGEEPPQSKNTYVCDKPGCNKTFKRSDHLLRHKRNHANNAIFHCSWPGCDKSFVRKDVRQKHFRRHVLAEQKSREREKDDKGDKFDKDDKNEKESLDNEVSVLSIPELPLLQLFTYPPQMAKPKESDGMDIDLFSELDSSPAKGEMSTIIDWLLEDTKEDPTKYFSYSPTSSIKDMLVNTPDFVCSTSQLSVSQRAMENMLLLMPKLRGNQLFQPEYIVEYLDAFWSIYHVQFPVIHRPTFSTEKAKPHLLLSIMAIGASLTSRNHPQFEVKIAMKKLAESIAEPLRWLIYSHSEASEMAFSWAIQSLLILECYEITCSNRNFHTRAHLHHGFKIELLRRSPLLGGHPMKSDYLDNNTASGVWENWLELESLKRCAYITFLVDTYQSAIFGHQAVLYAHHMKLSLPCPDIVWENELAETSNHVNNEKFLSILTRVLRQKKVSTTPFVRHILLVGLISLVFQTEQIESHLGAFQEQKSRSWKKNLLQAFDFWYDNVANSTCSEPHEAFYCPFELLNSGVFGSEDTTCKFPIYHLSQAFLRISQYDCIIYAGAPKRMNVKTDIHDYKSVDERVSLWANSTEGRLSVTHAYIFLIEMILSQDQSGNHVRVPYDPNKDPLFYRANVVASSLFLIWDYNFCIQGPESTYMEKMVDLNLEVPEKVNGFEYLERIKRAFDQRSGHGLTGSKKFAVYAECLPEIQNKHHMVGFLRLFQKSYQNCDSQICREYGRLLENCIKRSLGRPGIVCTKMLEDR